VTRLELGGMIAYDIPELGASMKVKVLQTVITEHTVKSIGVAVGFIKKLY
jgi:hypothetical protein